MMFPQKLFTFSMVALSLCCAGGNLLKNSGFEEKTPQGRLAFWGYNQSLVKQTGDSFREKNAVCFHIENPAGKKITRNVLTQSLHKVRPGNYQLSFYGRINGDGTLWATWNFHDQKGKLIPVKTYWTSNLRSSVWKKVTAKVTVPENAARITFHLLYTFSSSDRSGTGYLDEIQFIGNDRKDQLPEGAKLVFSDNFNRKDISGSWRIHSGKWSIRNGALYGTKNAAIFYNGKLKSPNLRMEYTAWSDTPGDLSAWLCGKQRRSECSGYFFGFGSMRNTVNRIGRENMKFALRGGNWDNLSDGIRKGKRHRVVVQRNYDELTLTVDGKKLLEGSDPCFTSCLEPLAGLYIWDGGWIDDVKIYELPYVGSSTVERKITTRKIWQFDQKESGSVNIAGGDLKIVDVPSYEYKSGRLGLRKKSDPALQLSGKKIKVDFATGKLDSGIVDLDLFSEQNKPFSIELLDQNGKVLTSLDIHKDQTFHSGKNALRSQVRWTRRRYDVPLKFEPFRWYTLRIQFDFKSGLIRFALLDMYTEITTSGWPEGNLGNYLTLGSMRVKSSDSCVVKLRIRADQGQKLLADNIYAFGPVGHQINGKSTDRPARELLGVKQLLRQDPLRLKHFSSRHFPSMNDTRELGFASPAHKQFIHKKTPNYTIFRKAGYQYDRTLIRLAFIREKISILERSCFYDGNKRIEEQLGQFKIRHSLLEKELEKALRIYGDAYWNNFDSKALNRIYSVLDPLEEKIEKLDKELDRKSDQNAFKVPSHVSHEDFNWDPASRAFVRDGKVMIWPYSSFWFLGHYGEEANLLGYYNTKNMGTALIPTNSAQNGIFLNDQSWQIKMLRKWPRNDSKEEKKIYLVQTGVAHFPTMIAPPWWLEKHRHDPDIFFCDESGKFYSEKYAPTGSHFLNYWNRAVQKMMELKYRDIGRFVAEECASRAKAIIHGCELSNNLPNGSHPGFNKSALHAFRQQLKKKYGSIANLNACWKSSFASFDSIEIPRKGNEVPGLVYEFNRFYQEGFAQWIANVRKILRKHTDKPFLSDQQATFGGNDKIEPVSYIRELDIKLCHTYQDWDRKTIDRWHGLLTETLQKRYGTLEWVGAQGIGNMFALEPIRINMNRELFQQLMWGAAMINTTYGVGYGNWQYGIRIYHPTLDMGVFTYLAGSTAVSHDRIRRFGEIALSAKTILPQTAILESTTSYYHGLNVRMTMNPIAESLAENAWDFNVLYENLLLENKQTLDNVKFIFLPNGKRLKEKFRMKLFQWIRNGGILASVGAVAGEENEFGIPVKNYPFSFRKKLQVQTVRYGKGQIIYLPAVPEDPAAFMAKYVKKNVGSDNHAFQFRFCQWKNKKYLFAVNWSMKRETGTFFVPGVFKSVRDLGLLRQTWVRAAHRGNQTFFTTRLNPGEGTVFVLE